MKKQILFVVTVFVVSLFIAQTAALAREQMRASFDKEDRLATSKTYSSQNSWSFNGWWMIWVGYLRPDLEKAPVHKPLEGFMFLLLTHRRGECAGPFRRTPRD